MHKDYKQILFFYLFRILYILFSFALIIVLYSLFNYLFNTSIFFYITFGISAIIILLFEYYLWDLIQIKLGFHKTIDKNGSIIKTKEAQSELKKEKTDTLISKIIYPPLIIGVIIYIYFDDSYTYKSYPLTALAIIYFIIGFIRGRLPLYGLTLNSRREIIYLIIIFCLAISAIYLFLNLIVNEV